MKHWFVINIKPRKEGFVESLFAEGGFTIYNPKRLRDNNKICFLFPGYAFIFFDYPAQYKLVKYTRGVKSVLGTSLAPIPVPEEFISEIRSREKNGVVELQNAGEIPVAGDEIEITCGPLKGVRGIFKKELKDRERVAILLNYISYQARLITSKSSLRKVS
ncbi:MAG: transcription termination/antitermination NusG family protein [Candidatus Aminicenantales bacterium]